MNITSLFNTGKKEKLFLDWMKNNFDVIAVIVVTIAGIFCRYKMIPYSHSDFTSYVCAWYDQLKADGGLLGLKYYTGNYNYPYPTILALLTYIPINKYYTIKGVGILFDLAMAVVSGLLCRKVYGNKYSFSAAYICVFMSPLVMLNGAYWGQCDSIYTCFILLALLFMLSEKYPLSFLIYGVAVAFKIQALFIFPLFVIIYLINKKYSILNFLLIPIGFLVTSLTGMIFSQKGIKGIYNILFSQIDEGELLSANFPNIYYWFPAQEYDLYLKVGLMFVLFTFVFICLYLQKNVNKLDNDAILGLGVWTVLCCAYLIPKMHERYGFVAEVLLLIWVMGHKKWLWYAILVITIILFSYFTVLHGYNLYLFQNMGMINIIAFVVFSLFLFSDIKKKAKIYEVS